jgi:hypothetical protein
MTTPILERTEVPDHQAPVRAFRRPRRRQIVVGILAVALLLVVVLAAFGVPSLQLLSTGILVLSLAVVMLLAVGALVVALLLALGRRERPPVTSVRPWLQRATRLASVGAVLLVGLGAVAVGSQAHASTSQLLGANGQPISGSIATVEQVTLNSSQQWITIRGKNAHSPVLLFLMGGPGAGGFPDQSFLAPLEDHFVVVNWDQPGTGKRTSGSCLRSGWLRWHGCLRGRWA